MPNSIPLAGLEVRNSLPFRAARPQVPLPKMNPPPSYLITDYSPLFIFPNSVLVAAGDLKTFIAKLQVKCDIKVRLQVETKHSVGGLR